ncbi:MAG: hypothetical protein B7Y39_09735 [Bdellovibrio sp. 28-41-41]|nr:MAG: hypothetical protein B7Y39_09735 [Bdellovibrio sp. 28-41-41]
MKQILLTIGVLLASQISMAESTTAVTNPNINELKVRMDKDQIRANLSKHKVTYQLLSLGQDRGGGDEVALEFQRAFAVALRKLKNEQPQVFQKFSIEKLEKRASSINVIVVDDALNISVKEIIQNSIATNARSTNTILINRTRWNAISDDWLKEGIALHEIASLEGLEQTGYYPISSIYVSLMGGSSNSLEANLSVNTLKQIVALNPQASPKEILKKLFEESSVPASVSDFDLNTDKKSNQECQGVGFPDIDGLAPMRIRRALVPIQEALPDGGPLFPARPAIKEDRVVFAIQPQQFERLTDDPEFLGAWSHGASTIMKTETELLEKTRYTSHGQVNALENNLLARRSGGLLIIKMFTVSLNPAVGVDSTHKYIYCYRH